MSVELGTVTSALVIDQNDKYYSVQKEGITYQLDKTEGEHEIGDAVLGFIYENMKHNKMMTTKLPDVRQGRYGWSTVTMVRKDLGVFVDIGLPDKEIVISLDDLPSEKHLWPKKDDRLLIRLEVDAKDRVWGKLADDSIFQQITNKLSPQSKSWTNQEVKGTVYHAKIVGTYVITDDYFLAFIHESERLEEPRLGQEVTGRVIGIGQNGNLNISLKPLAYTVISEDAQMILALLERQDNHFLPYHDKSNPDDIRSYFGISKAQFKRAVGNLLKNKQIEQVDGGIKLK
ncbi:DNA-binding protein [Aerococcus agrisoli]|uniref:DNA-binding protein n=1 Tax=Aerococcus agrisoli TaxID=2487350 RepID=A0A3N4GRL8_9LACT|nr:S1-like domain-containing RNA-binding protein [Aerococcus agrisoli]RPA61280.1 DNA-binding protein [Aerococcus agrisoli]